MDRKEQLEFRRHLGRCATLACLMEASAPKVGNVHRGADFADLTFYDFCAAAVEIAPPLERVAELGVGAAILQAVQATSRATRSNPNLGIALLLAPLAAVDDAAPLSREAVRQVLGRLTPADAGATYQAIRLAAPGGLGSAESMDVQGPAPDSLLAAMQAAAERDQVAEQYATDFAYVLDVLARNLERHCAEMGWSRGIVHVQLISLSQRGDSLIRRKCGDRVAEEARDRAAHALDQGAPDSESYHYALSELDFWMRSDGNRRNPGATADLIAAALFGLLRDGRLDIRHN
ncbi:MAG: triphosphoribosyl-dephospho-CoA synthase [Planctomycetales bacterium]|nr:triphosphoribosyl-dephospho-CoA synthase [Planctomycetales bacterium]